MSASPVQTGPTLVVVPADGVLPETSDPSAVDRALSVPTRAGIYRRLRTLAAPASAREVAEMFGIHPNVARNHLDVLVEAGLTVSSRRKNPAGGRPAKVYVAREQSTGGRPVTVPTGSQLAVRLLVQSLVAAGVGLDPIEQVAREQGTHLVAASAGRAERRDLEAAALVAVEALRAAFPEIRMQVVGEAVEVAGLDIGLRLVGEVDGRVADTLARGLVDGAVHSAGGAARIASADGIVTITAGVASRRRSGPEATVDARGQTYQSGVVATMRAIVELRPGAVVEVLTDTVGAPAAFARWADRAGHEVADVGRIRDMDGAEAVRLLIRKAAS